jgi:hypothetical protein
MHTGLFRIRLREASHICLYIAGDETGKQDHNQERSHLPPRIWNLRQAHRPARRIAVFAEQSGTFHFRMIDSNAP